MINAFTVKHQRITMDESETKCGIGEASARRCRTSGAGWRWAFDAANTKRTHDRIRSQPGHLSPHTLARSASECLSLERQGICSPIHQPEARARVFLPDSQRTRGHLLQGPYLLAEDPRLRFGLVWIGGSDCNPGAANRLTRLRCATLVTDRTMEWWRDHDRHAQSRHSAGRVASDRYQSRQLTLDDTGNPAHLRG
jgi:hypothetical protein